jgi:hypothetical protein
MTNEQSIDEIILAAASATENPRHLQYCLQHNEGIHISMDSLRALVGRSVLTALETVAVQPQYLNTESKSVKYDFMMQELGNLLS